MIPCKDCLVLPICKNKAKNIIFIQDMKCEILDAFIESAVKGCDVNEKLALFYKYVGLPLGHVKIDEYSYRRR